MIDKLLNKKNSIIVLSPTTKSCFPCEKSKEMIEHMSDRIKQYNGIDIFFMHFDINEIPDLIEKYSIKSVPSTIFIYTKTKKAIVKYGLLSYKEYEDNIKDTLKI